VTAGVWTRQRWGVVTCPLGETLSAARRARRAFRLGPRVFFVLLRIAIGGPGIPSAG
jgi:hypothetical protein